MARLVGVDLPRDKRLEVAAQAIVGQDVFSLNVIRGLIADRLRGDDAAVGTAGMITAASGVDQVLSPFEVACLDVQGHATGRRIDVYFCGAEALVLGEFGVDGGGVRSRKAVRVSMTSSRLA